MNTENLFGKKATKKRRNRLNELHLVLKGNRNWQPAFLERYVHLDTAEGGRMLGSVTRNTCDDLEMLRCFEDFIPFIRKTQPEWFKKQFSIEIPNKKPTIDGPEN